MNGLSAEARALILQARFGAAELIGPSERDRARLRRKLSQLWAATSRSRGTLYAWLDYRPHRAPKRMRFDRRSAVGSAARS